MSHDFGTAFSLSNMFKDLLLVNDQVTRTRAALPLTMTAIKEYSEAVNEGMGRDDFSIIALKVQHRNGLP